MIDKHKILFNQKMEQIAYTGYAILPKWQINSWFNVEHFTVTTRQYIREHWQILGKKDHPWTNNKSLRFAETNDRIFIIRSDMFFPDQEDY